MGMCVKIRKDILTFLLVRNGGGVPANVATVLAHFSHPRMSDHALVLFVCLLSSRTPVKKKMLVQDEVKRVLTPREKMAMRKKQRADMEAEKLKQEISQNYVEQRKILKEHKKKQQVGRCCYSIVCLHF